jgi:hypothetical protein
MTCKKSEFVTAINSFAAARTTGDENLQRLSGIVLEQLINTLEFAEEDNKDEDYTEVSETEVVAD